MRIKLDENLPTDALAVALQLGHDADTVNNEGLAGASDTDVLAASTQDERLLITLDRRFGDVRSYPPGTHGGIVVLRVASQDTSTIAQAVGAFLAGDELEHLVGCIVVVRGHLLRVRRPE